MNEIIRINYESLRPTVSARELHEFLEVDSNYTTWFKRMAEYGFTENEDYTSYLPNLESESHGGQNKQDHQITVDMAKEIAMLQRSDKGKEVRKYFIELERHWNSPEQVMARALDIANKTIANLKNRIVEDRPKIEFFDQVASSKSAIEMGNAAKVLNIKGIGRNRLFEILRDEQVLMKNNVPYQKFVDLGYFRVIEQKYTKPNGDVQINLKTLVYQKGLAFIKKLLSYYTENDKKELPQRPSSSNSIS